MATREIPSTLKPAQVAVVMVEAAVAKHRTRADKVFAKAVSRIPAPILSHSSNVATPWLVDQHPQFFAGVMLSFGGLLSEIIQAGSAGINSSNPGLVKILGGAVFPVGLVMYVPVKHSASRSLI